MFRNTLNLNDHIYVNLPTDDKGLTTRLCPQEECKGVFKVKFGTGLKGENLPCHCPYCGWTSDAGDFETPEQIEYAKSVALNQLMSALSKDLKDWARELEQSTRNSLIKMKLEVKGDGYVPIRYYQEKQLETHITCNECTLEYAIYGVFAFCPDCGIHNSFQILEKNLELVEKEITLAESLDDKDFRQHLIQDALENAVSAFDGFGRATCSAFASKASEPERAKEISFQNINGARVKVQALLGFDLAGSIEPDQWVLVIRCFQKRHLFAHTMGVIDDDYIRKANDPTAVIGRKIATDSNEVRELAGLLKAIGSKLYENLK